MGYSPMIQFKLLRAAASASLLRYFREIFEDMKVFSEEFSRSSSAMKMGIERRDVDSLAKGINANVDQVNRMVHVLKRYESILSKLEKSDET